MGILTFPWLLMICLKLINSGVALINDEICNNIFNNCNVIKGMENPGKIINVYEAAKAAELNLEIQ